MNIFLVLVMVVLILLGFRCVMMSDEWFEEHKHAVGGTVALMSCALIMLYIL